MPRGVSKDLAVKAQEQYDKQLRLVERLKTKREALMSQVLQINDSLGEEQKLLEYYGQHPLVKQTPAQMGLPLDLDGTKLDYSNDFKATQVG